MCRRDRPGRCKVGREIGRVDELIRKYADLWGVTAKMGWGTCADIRR